MGQVLITLNGRTYRMACGDGQEVRLERLADHLKSKVDTLAIEFGQVGEERLLLMAGLLVTDELFEAREQIAPAEIAMPVSLASPVDTSPSAQNLPSVPFAERQAVPAQATVPASTNKPKVQTPQFNANTRKPGRN